MQLLQRMGPIYRDSFGKIHMKWEKLQGILV